MTRSSNSGVRYSPSLDVFKTALNPQRVDGQRPAAYVYVISKRFRVYDEFGPDEDVAVKIGAGTFSGYGEGGNPAARLDGLRTALVSFHVHRIYTYVFDAGTSGGFKEQGLGEAGKAEKQLHTAVQKNASNYGSNEYDVRFPFSENVSNSKMSEWFRVDSRRLADFLDFVDDFVRNKAYNGMIRGYAFSRVNGEPKVEQIKSARDARAEDRNRRAAQIRFQPDGDQIPNYYKTKLQQTTKRQIDDYKAELKERNEELLRLRRLNTPAREELIRRKIKSFT